MNKDNKEENDPLYAVDENKTRIEKKENEASHVESKGIYGFLRIIWRAYMNIYESNPILWLAGTFGILMAAPLPFSWEHIYSIGVDLFAKLRGILGV